MICARCHGKGVIVIRHEPFGHHPVCCDCLGSGRLDCCDINGVIDTDADPRPHLTVVSGSPSHDVEDGLIRAGKMVDVGRAADRSDDAVLLPWPPRRRVE
jgi:hypothetical protein